MARVVTPPPQQEFDEYKLVVPDSAHPEKTTTETREGAVTRILYRVPPGHTALELLRNYEQTVKEAGLTEDRWSWRRNQKACDWNW